MSVYKKLSEIQSKLNAPKSQRNDFGKYNYRNCEDILQAVKPLLGDAVIVISDEIKLIGERYYVEATAKMILDGEIVENKAYAREQILKKGMDESQITGAASSYARKYALNGLLLIDDNKDADTMNGKDDSELLDRLKTDELSAVHYWRGLTKAQQKHEWSKIDKPLQATFTEVLNRHPEIKAA